MRELSDKDIFICTDSQTAIEAVSSPVVGSRSVYDCKVRLNELSNLNRVTLLWVPGHEGIPGNEKADELAGLGAEARFIGPEPMFGIAKATRKSVINKWLSKKHQAVWSDYEGGRHTKVFCRSISKEIGSNLINLSRPNVKRVVESITNHCGLNKYLFDIGCHDTGAHIIGECPRYRLLRKTFLGKPEIPRLELTLEALDIVSLSIFLERTRKLP